jgi:hypothetical protein
LDYPPDDCRYCDGVDVLRIRCVYFSAHLRHCRSRFSVSKSPCAPHSPNNPNHACGQNY